MSCCGNKREQFLAAGAAISRRDGPAGRPPGYAAPPARVLFEYSGRAPLIVIGPVSGRRYRFDGHGSRIEVDPRDRRSVAVTPGLRQISG